MLEVIHCYTEYLKLPVNELDRLKSSKPTLWLNRCSYRWRFEQIFKADLKSLHKPPAHISCTALYDAIGKYVQRMIYVTVLVTIVI